MPMSRVCSAVLLVAGIVAVYLSEAGHQSSHAELDQLLRQDSLISHGTFLVLQVRTEAVELPHRREHISAFTSTLLLTSFISAFN